MLVIVCAMLTSAAPNVTGNEDASPGTTHAIIDELGAVGVMAADPAPAVIGNSATATYNVLTGELRISANNVVNVFVEDELGSLTLLGLDAALGATLLTANNFRVGLTGPAPFSLQDWGGFIGGDHLSQHLAGQRQVRGFESNMAGLSAVPIGFFGLVRGNCG